MAEIMTNFRAEDMLGTKKAAPAPKVAAPKPAPAPVVEEPKVEEPVVVEVAVEVEEPVAEQE